MLDFLFFAPREKTPCCYWFGPLDPSFSYLKRRISLPKAICTTQRSLTPEAHPNDHFFFFFYLFMDFCSYLDFSLPGRRFVLHNDNFVHLISFHIFSLFSWKAILPTQRYFCPFAFFSFFYCIFSGKAIITTQRCFRQFIVSFFIYRLMLVLISVLICVVILV